MVELVKYLDTRTNRFFDVTKPVTFEEDQEACALAGEHFMDAIEDECSNAFVAGWNGWNRADLCPIPHLVEKMKKAFNEGDIVKTGVYLMMLHGRGVHNFEAIERQRRLTELSEDIARLLEAEYTLAKLDGDTSAHIKVMADLRHEANKLDKERQVLLKLQG